MPVTYSDQMPRGKTHARNELYGMSYPDLSQVVYESCGDRSSSGRMGAHTVCKQNFMSAGFASGGRLSVAFDRQSDGGDLRTLYFSAP